MARGIARGPVGLKMYAAVVNPGDTLHPHLWNRAMIPVESVNPLYDVGHKVWS